MLKDLPQYHQGTAAEANARKLLAERIKDTALIDALCVGFRLSDMLTANINEMLSTHVEQESNFRHADAREENISIKRTTENNRVFVSIRVFDSSPVALDITHEQKSLPFYELILSERTIARTCADHGAFEFTSKTIPSHRIYLIPCKGSIKVAVQVLCTPTTTSTYYQNDAEEINLLGESTDRQRGEKLDLHLWHRVQNRAN